MKFDYSVRVDHFNLTLISKDKKMKKVLALVITALISFSAIAADAPAADPKATAKPADKKAAPAADKKAMPTPSAEAPAKK